MFRVEDFADMVQSAATNSLEDPKLCAEFTDAMDLFGDMMRGIEITGPFTHSVRGARLELTQLIRLHNGTQEASDPRTQALFDSLWTQLGLAIYEKNAVEFDYSVSISPYSANHIA